MYPVSDKWKEKIYGDGIKSKINIYINEQLVDVKILELKISHILYNNDSSISLGTTTSQSLELKLFKKDLPTNINIIKIEYGILIDDEYEMIPLGIYNVDSIEDTNNKTITIKASDNMIKFEVNYDGSILNYPATIKTVLLDICNKVGVQLGTSTFLNENTEIAVWDNTVSARKYLSYISEKAGCIAVIGRDGKLYLKSLYESSETIPLRLFKKYEWGEKHTITGVKFQDGIRTYSLGNSSGNTLWISSDNMFITSSVEIEDIYEKINGLVAYSFNSGTTRINPALDVGDKVIIDGKEVIYQYEIELKGRFLGTINSKLSDKAKEDTTVKKVSNDTKIRRVQSEINQIDGKITQIVQETDENSEKISKNEQDIASINQTVSSFTNFTKTIEGKVKILLEDALETNILKLVLYAENTNSGIYPSARLFPSSTLFPQKAGNSFTIFVENENRTQNKEFFFNCIYPLRTYNGVHDQLIIEFDKKKGCCLVKVLKYIEKIGDVYTVRNEPLEKILDDNLQLILFKGNNYISIKEYQNWNIEATYIFNNELNDLYATQIYMSSVIKQLADEILLEVSKKVGDEELIAKINLTPETIKIIASKLALEGYTTINGGFSIDEKGNASIANGAVKIDNTGIKMADGTSIIGGKGLMSNLEFSSKSNINTNVVSGSYYPLGFWSNSLNSQNFKTQLIIDAYIPKNFVIESAYIVLHHFPIKVYNGNSYMGMGYSRKVKIYTSSTSSRYLNFVYGSEFTETYNGYNSEISNSGLDINGWTPINYASNEIEEKISNDISKSLKIGNNQIIVESSENIPSYNSNSITNMSNIMAKTGMMNAFLYVYGYMNISKK